MHVRLRAGREVQHGHHLLARGTAQRRRVVDALPGKGDHPERHGHGGRRGLLRCRRRGAPSAGRGDRPRLQRGRHAAPPVELDFSPLPERARQQQRPGGQEPDVPTPSASCRGCSGSGSTATRVRLDAACSANEFYETDPERNFVRGYMMQIIRGGVGPWTTAMTAPPTGRSPGARGTTKRSGGASTTPPLSAFSARTCPTRKTG